MFCSNCGKPLREGSRFCSFCGTPVEQESNSQPSSFRRQTGAHKKRSSHGWLIGAITASIAALAAVGLLLFSPGEKDGETGGVFSDFVQPSSNGVETLARPQILSFAAEDAETDVTPSVAAYGVSQDLSNITNRSQFYLSDEEVQLLSKNLFVVSKGYNSEFFELYETNRYSQIPNFVTVDSMMHTYHLYFSLLLNRTEKNYLAAELLALSDAMLQSSLEQYQALVGTEWEEAARRNVAFFAVAAKLQAPERTVPDAASELAARELDAIYAAAGIDYSELAENYVDYSQFLPRGYYEGDPVLEPYFRAMMWYGQINFSQSSDSLNRSALLMTLAMGASDLSAWEKIYTVTSFFAGSSDDLGYYEYAPAIQAAYGSMPAASALAGDESAYRKFTELVGQMTPPAINSVPVPEGMEDIEEQTKGFRFMGQRFTIDAAVMQQLIYSNVKENSSGEKRMLPDVLDVPAALGSDVALQLLEQQGDTAYSGYSENMSALRTLLQSAPEDYWSTSLYSSWLYTLQPLLEPKGAGYPSFMNSTEWLKKDLETYAGSFTELKHDTVLYAKQVMAEMGGGPEEIVDDRGYVEPETEVYRRFQLLAQQTAEGLNGYGLIGSEDLENLSRLAELARQLMTISQKELQNELLTDEEYELIRCYGGTLEHFWTEAVKEKYQSDWLDAKEIPASLVTDVATDPNGSVLQLATGRPAEILVVVPIDGELHLASGVVFDFYQFEQPLNERLTDTAWRQLIGEWMTADGNYNWDSQVEKPWWTRSYWSGQ